VNCCTLGHFTLCINQIVFILDLDPSNSVVASFYINYDINLFFCAIQCAGTILFTLVLLFSLYLVVSNYIPPELTTSPFSNLLFVGIAEREL
jgi:hypothetical protein